MQIVGSAVMEASGEVVQVGEDEILAALGVLREVNPDSYEFLGEDALRGIVTGMLQAAAKARLPGMLLASGDRIEKGDAFSDGLTLWRCTDVGQRTLAGYRLDLLRITETGPDGILVKRLVDPRQDLSRQLGPPYSIPERVFDEDDLDGIHVVPEDSVDGWKSLIPAIG